MTEYNNGYVILASTDQQQRAAALCAYSIKIKNNASSVTMITPDLRSVNQDYEEPFDMIVELPFAAEDNLRANDWQLYWATPYENTIALDCFTIIKEDQTNIWEYLISQHNVAIPQRGVTFRNEIIGRYADDSGVYVIHDFKHLYSNFIFFNKSESSLAYFKLMDPYLRNWRDAVSKSVESRFVPDRYDTDLMHSICAWHLGIHEDIVPRRDIFKNIDMREITARYRKTMKIEHGWSEHLNTWISNSAKLKIQNFAIDGILYYEDPGFNTAVIFDGHRNYFRELGFKANLVDKV
jgi:hypothetical protein